MDEGGGAAEVAQTMISESVMSLDSSVQCKLLNFDVESVLYNCVDQCGEVCNNAISTDGVEICSVSSCSENMEKTLFPCHDHFSREFKVLSGSRLPSIEQKLKNDDFQIFGHTEPDKQHIICIENKNKCRKF